MNTRRKANLDRFMSDSLGNAVSVHPVSSNKIWGGAPSNAPSTAEPAQQSAAQSAFARWVQRAYPSLYELAMQRAQNGRRRGNGLGQTEGAEEKTGILDRFVGAMQEIAPTYLQYKAQKDILDVQLDRARQGLPPLESREYAPTMQIGLDEQTVRRIANEATTRAGAGASALAQSPLTWIIGGVAAFTLFSALSKKNGRRRRRASPARR